MAVLLMRLRHVPADELEEIRQLLDAHDIGYYETTAGNWGISLPALWLSDNARLEDARTLLGEYAEQRHSKARAVFEALKEAGKARTFLDIARENPLRVVSYLAIVAALVYISVVPFLNLSA